MDEWMDGWMNGRMIVPAVVRRDGAVRLPEYVLRLGRHLVLSLSLTLSLSLSRARALSLSLSLSLSLAPPLAVSCGVGDLLHGTVPARDGQPAPRAALASHQCVYGNWESSY